MSRSRSRSLDERLSQSSSKRPSESIQSSSRGFKGSRSSSTNRTLPALSAHESPFAFARVSARACKQPFLLSLRLGNIPGSEALLDDPAGEQFRSDGIAVAAAAIGIVEWLRSRLPRYPIRFKLPYTSVAAGR